MTEDNAYETESASHDGTQADTDTSMYSANSPHGRPKSKRPVFNLTDFMQSADSLASVVAGESIRFRYVITTRLDTTKGDFAGLQPSQAEKVQHYRLIPSKGNGKWDIGILRMEYKATNDLNEAYAVSEKNIGKNNLNNFIFKYPGQLVWLYTGCSYSKVRMEELRNNLLRDLDAGNITGSTSRMCS